MNARNETSLRTMNLREAGAYAEAGWCRVPGCNHGTSDRKPYCLEHLDRMFYVRKIQAELAAMAEPAAAFGGVPFRKAV